MRLIVLIATLLPLCGCKLLASEVRELTNHQLDPESFYMEYGHDEFEGRGELESTGYYKKKSQTQQLRHTGNNDGFRFGMTFNLRDGAPPPRDYDEEK